MADYKKEFFLFVHERGGCSLSVLAQRHGKAMRPLGYFSAVLDNVAAALPGCLKAVAACALAIKQCEGLVMRHTLTVLVPHSVEILLTKIKTQHLTVSRLTKYEEIILASENVQVVEDSIYG